ncbi:hypothetical protein SeMB42_g01586 [Synchytrium endobioticum]|uniref:RING-type E3 ubiquitin transferase n=1 Tax=Synchytrium endobioticum TaxID=286115 RepID=A0A507DL90_9FUNG|nr:hypothetical protein SeMB42_g01586 [Synchytrium endobioticum]
MGTGSSSIQDDQAETEVDDGAEQQRPHRHSAVTGHQSISERERRVRDRVQRIRNRNIDTDTNISDVRAMRPSVRRTSRFSPLATGGSATRSPVSSLAESSADTPLSPSNSSNTERMSIMDAMRSRFSSSSLSTLLSRIVFRNSGHAPSESVATVAQLSEGEVTDPSETTTSPFLQATLPAQTETATLAGAEATRHSIDGSNASESLTVPTSDTSSTDSAAPAADTRGTRTIPILVIGIRPTPSLSIPSATSAPSIVSGNEERPYNTEGGPENGVRSAIASTISNLLLRRARNNVMNRSSGSPLPASHTSVLPENFSANAQGSNLLEPAPLPRDSFSENTTTRGTQTNARQTYIIYILAGNIELPPGVDPPAGLVAGLNAAAGGLGSTLADLASNSDDATDDEETVPNHASAEDRDSLSDLFNPDIFAGNTNGNRSSTDANNSGTSLPTSQQNIPPGLLALLSRVLREGSASVGSDATSLGAAVAAANDDRAGYEDLLSLADLIGSARPRHADIRDVESQLPTLVFGMEESKKDNRVDADGDVIMSDVLRDGNLSSNNSSSQSVANNTTATADTEARNSSNDSSTTEFNELKRLRLADLLASTNEKCSICLEHYEKGEELRLMKCRHGFHKDCLNKWLTTAVNSCPLCKTPAVVVTHAPTAPTQSSGLLGDDGSTSVLGGGLGVVALLRDTSTLIPLFPSATATNAAGDAPSEVTRWFLGR